MTDNELKELVAGLAVSNAENAKAFEKLQTENAKLHAVTEAQMNRTDETLKRMGIHLGGITDNNGSNTEDYFYNSLVDNPVLGGIKYDSIAKNFQIKSKRTQGEFDIVMFNGDNVALIECKYKAHEKDVEKLIHKKVYSFKELFPIYANHKFYLGIA
ncbi:MAG: hypothetical protein WCP65_04480, partial [Bacteroidota bacterium]